MSDETLQQSINALINGTINEIDHQSLQNRLKEDATARATFRERMDIEAGLRTWAADIGAHDQVSTSDSASKPNLRTAWSWRITFIATAASILAFVFWWTQRPDRDEHILADQQNKTTTQAAQLSAPPLGKWIAQAACVWQQPPSLPDGVFNAGMMKLTSGAAELRFDSGTNVILEGPCELLVSTADSARLLSGKVYVNVTEVSNGFLLETPDAQIIDEGTQYAVALDSLATEVHVFDGSVIWTSTAADVDADANFEDRIVTGEARRYLRSEPGRSRYIPFGQRQFVRRIDEQVREAAGGALLAYDGFENLAGQLRRDRSGFGWSGGWESAGFGRGKLGEVVDAPAEVVFGNDRSGRRLLSLHGGESLRRQFEKPIELKPGETIFVSLLISRQTSEAQSSREQSAGNSTDDEQSAAIQIVLEPDSVSPRFTRRHSVSFGVGSDQRLFLNNSGAIDETAMSLGADEPHLLVLMYKAESNMTTANLRVYRADQLVDEAQPSVWTVHGTASTGPTKLASIRISLGPRAAAQIDELRISDSWNAAIDLGN